MGKTYWTVVIGLVILTYSLFKNKLLLVQAAKENGAHENKINLNIVNICT